MQPLGKKALKICCENIGGKVILMPLNLFILVFLFYS
jgi:hypothetical protein